jgi:hypothetical protein
VFCVENLRSDGRHAVRIRKRIEHGRLVHVSLRGRISRATFRPDDVIEANAWTNENPPQAACRHLLSSAPIDVAWRLGGFEPLTTAGPARSPLSPPARGGRVGIGATSSEGCLGTRTPARLDGAPSSPTQLTASPMPSAARLVGDGHSRLRATRGRALPPPPARRRSARVDATRGGSRSGGPTEFEARARRT